MSFITLAEPFLKHNIPVFPVKAHGKAPITPGGCKDATINIDQVRTWDTQYPGCNIGIAALSGGDICFLEFDAYGIKAAAEEFGQSVPKTRVQKSGSGGGHYIFTHTERSRKLGNRAANLKAVCTCAEKENRPCRQSDCNDFTAHHHHEWFSFRADNMYLVGAGSLHPNGNLYKTIKDVAPIPIPDWVCDFVAKHTSAPAPKPKGGLSVDDNFDFDAFCDHYDISIAGEKDDVWQIVEECPGVGYRHEGSYLTGFYWDGNTLGWSCFAQGCPLHGKSIGQVIQFLNQSHEPYKGVIWEQDDSKLDGVDYVDDPTIPDEEEKHAPPPSEPAEVTNMTDAERQELADNAAKASAYSTKMQALQQDEDEESEPDEGQPEADKPTIDPTLHYAGMYKVSDDNSLGLLVKDASDFVMAELEWLWPGRIPKGKITLYTGKPDGGKSLALLDLIACVTTGKDFPDGAQNTLPPSKVLLAATEDDPADTIIPRLIAAGADVSKVKIILGTVVISKKDKKLKKKRTNLDIKRDAKILLDAIKEIPDLALVALDPITGFLGDVDVNKDKDVRPVLEELNRVLNKAKITCVGIIHSSKRSDVDAVHKVSGAGSMAAVVRAVWGFSRNPEDKSDCRMSFVKGNLGKVKGGVKYKIEGTPVCINGKSIDTPYIVWGEKTEEDADDLLKAERANKDGADSKMLIATSLIRSMLPAKAKDIFKKGEQEGVSDNTIRRARYKIDGLIARQRSGEWWWFIDGNGPSSPAAEKIMSSLTEQELASIM
jgi:putative DNA primase/helicase